MTLYRPRDVISLLNIAWQAAGRARRESIIETDLEGAADEVSSDRLNDLVREYEYVFPGLPEVVSVFKGSPAQRTYGAIVDALDECASRAVSGRAQESMGLFDSGEELFNLLFSVGLLGLEQRGTGEFRFCHDGSNVVSRGESREQRVAVHPAYWRALGCHVDEAEGGLIVRVDDTEAALAQEGRKEDLMEFMWVPAVAATA
jgi:hypothetical protein